MVSSFDEEFLINSTIDNYNNNLKYKEILVLSLCEIVSNNTIGQNQEIIFHYSGDVYDAISIYTKFFNNTYNFLNDKETFYKDMAYVSLYKYLEERIEEIIEDQLSEYDTDSVEDVD